MRAILPLTALSILLLAGMALAAPPAEAPPGWFGLLAAWLGCDAPPPALEVLDELDMAFLLGDADP